MARGTEGSVCAHMPAWTARLLRFLLTFDPVRLLLPLAEACDIDDSGEDGITACLCKLVEDDVKQILASGIRIEVDISLHNLFR